MMMLAGVSADRRMAFMTRKVNKANIGPRMTLAITLTAMPGAAFEKENVVADAAVTAAR